MNTRIIITTRTSLLALASVTALGSSFLVPADALAFSRGFAHAAQVSRSVPASTGSVRTASVGFQRSTGFQRPVSSGRVASGSFTQRRFGSANTAGSHSPLANRTFGHTTTPTNTPQLNKLASNGAQPNTTHALADPCSGLGAPKTCFLNQGKGVAGTNNQPAPAPAPAPAPKTTGGADKCSGVGAPATCFLNQGKGVAGTNNQPTPAPAPAPKTTGADKCSGVGAPATCFLNQGKGVDGTGGSAAALGAKTTTGGGTGGTGTGIGTGTGTGGGTGTGTGSGGNTNANNGNGNGGNHPHPFPGGHPFPGQFPVVVGIGHGPFVVGGSVAPYAIAPVAYAGGAVAPVPPSAARPLAPSCLTKTYLQTGVVMFRDVCSQEWAINGSNITNPAPTSSACLSKESPQNGVVLFKDNCTSEWAMNPQPANNQAQAN
jgi:hypothetical protein